MTTQPSREPDDAPKWGIGDFVLMDAGLNFASRLRAEMLRTSVDVARFSLPLWADDRGAIRIALPVRDPEHGCDNVQLVIPLGELISVVGQAVAEQAQRSGRTGEVGA